MVPVRPMTGWFLKPPFAQHHLLSVPTGSSSPFQQSSHQTLLSPLPGHCRNSTSYLLCAMCFKVMWPHLTNETWEKGRLGALDQGRKLPYAVLLSFPSTTMTFILYIVTLPHPLSLCKRKTLLCVQATESSSKYINKLAERSPVPQKDL